MTRNIRQGRQQDSKEDDTRCDDRFRDRESFIFIFSAAMFHLSH